jgi:hypothetical protein
MLENILRTVSIAHVAYVIVFFLLLLHLRGRMQENAKIKRLGLRAPSRSSWIPFGLDIAYGGAMSVIKNGTLQYFNDGKAFPKSCPI